MKALQLIAPGTALEVAEVDVPDTGSGEVLVRVAGCGVCHTDIGFWRDGVPTRHPLPLTLGHEISGTVVEAGEDCQGWIGREVVIPAVIPCDACELCHTGRSNVCRAQVMPGNDIPGGFAEYIAVPARGLCRVEDRGGYELFELAVLADAVTTPYQAIARSGLTAGDVAIVVGAGGVGAYCVQIAAALGAHVVAIDVNDARLALVAAHGAGLTINSAATVFKALRKQVAAQVEAWGAAAHSWKIFECSGHPGGQETAYGLLTHAATLLVVGFSLARIELRLSNLMAYDATAQGTWGCRPELYPEALRLVTGGQITLNPFIERHPMSAGPALLAQVANHEIQQRAILVPDWPS